MRVPFGVRRHSPPRPCAFGSGYRFYSPNLGRWLSRDPLEEEAAFGCYEMCFNDTGFFVDPDGKAPEHWPRWGDKPTTQPPKPGIPSPTPKAKQGGGIGLDDVADFIYDGLDSFIKIWETKEGDVIAAGKARCSAQAPQSFPDEPIPGAPPALRAPRCQKCCVIDYIREGKRQSHKGEGRYRYKLLSAVVVNTPCSQVRIPDSLVDSGHEAITDPIIW